MKVLLLQSYLGGNEPPVFPLGLACLRPYLNDFNVRIYDPNISLKPYQELRDIIKDFSPDAIALSLRNIDSTNKREVVFYYGYLKKTVDIIKSCSEAKIIVGGGGFSMYAREIMEDEPKIDYGVTLEGEHTFPRLLRNFDNPEKVKSVFYRKNGGVFFSEQGQQVDLNNLSLPDRTSIPIDNYKNIPEAIGVETKRGCALNCIYCIYGFLNGRQYRLRNPVSVVDEIEALTEKFGVERFTFVDSIFNIPAAHAENICKEIIRRRVKIKWSAWFNEKHFSKEFIELVREAGCKNIILSPDGFSDETLKMLGKNITQKDIINAFNVLKDFDELEVSYNFFKNPPGQSLSNFFSLAFFCIKAKMELKKKVHFEFNSIRIEPHTELHKIAIEQGFVEKDDNLLHPRYYTNPGTGYIEKIFNVLLRLKGK